MDIKSESAFSKRLKGEVIKCRSGDKEEDIYIKRDKVLRTQHHELKKIRNYKSEKFMYFKRNLEAKKQKRNSKQGNTK